MSVKNENAAGNESVVLERPAAGGVYASLFEKINLNPVSELSALDIWQDAQAMSDATADERLTAGMKVFLECLTKAGSKVEKLDKNLIDHHIAELDYQISRQLDAVMHHEDFQAVESLWRGVKSLVDKTDFRQNVKVELLDMSKEDLRQDFEDCPEIVQSGLYKHTYIDEYDTPGGEPIAALISAYEFDASAQDVALLRNISKVSAAAHMPFIGSAGPKFFLKDNMEDVAAIKDIGNYFDRAEYIKWKSFRETDDSRYIGLVMPRVLGRLPYGPDTAFSGYQLLLEYFSFRPKFMFVELRGLDTIGLTEASSWFEIDIVLSEAWSSDLPFETENFRLHCAPVINLFTLEADPLTLNPLDNEYLLRPLRLQDGHTEIYSVDNIHGAVKNGKHPYVPFTSFRHRGGMMRHDAPERYFHTRVKRGPSGLYDTWLILGGRSFELEQLSDKPESLSMRITGTNGQLPRKALESTLLDRAVKAGKVPVRVPEYAGQSCAR
ncbi:hypothetical protein TUM17561_05210 [Enterobacter cloacae]|nr:hypothetical protein TUM17561_05210 [Enterobacter cloacae]